MSAIRERSVNSHHSKPHGFSVPVKNASDGNLHQLLCCSTSTGSSITRLLGQQDHNIVVYDEFKYTLQCLGRKTWQELMLIEKKAHPCLSNDFYWTLYKKYAISLDISVLLFFSFPL